MTRLRATALGFAFVVMVAMGVSGCTPSPGPSETPSNEGTAPAEPAEGSAIDWLLHGAGADTLADVPGSVWGAQTSLEVTAACGPTDQHHGWTVSGLVVPTSRIPDGFDPGAEFELAHSNAQRTWEHVTHRRLRLTEQEDGRVDGELFVPRNDAPEWEDVDQAEVVFGPERCG